MYLCALRPGGEPVDRMDIFGEMARLRHSRDSEFTTITAGPFTAVVATGPRLLRPLSATWHHLVAIGDVRLDNRVELARLAGAPTTVSDLEIVLRAIDRHGEKLIPTILGDFAFVVWDGRAHKLIAARDAFGVKPLYYRATRDLILLSCRMDALAAGERYDLEHMADFLSGLVAPGERTIWADVKTVPAAGFLLQRGTVRTARRFWSAEDFRPAETASEPECIEEFQTLFREAIRTRIGQPGTTWSQLSGGLDSSSVVATAQTISGAGNGIAGTVTVVDTLGNGDERTYSDAVVRRYELRNEQVRDYWAWQDDGCAPPATDGPRPLYPFYARDRRMCDVIRNAGGRVLLSGFGSDHYLLGNLNYIDDLSRRGRLVAAARELGAWSIGSRQSFWGMARQHMLAPWLPARLRARAVRQEPLPDYIDPAFARAWTMESRSGEASVGGPPGASFARSIARNVGSIPAWIDRWPFGEDVEVRYPFLHRPLVEACLRMPASARVRPGVNKWVLRQAVRGLLPEEVRRRGSKGSIDARILWSLQHEKQRLDELLRDPVLARLGCVRADELRRTVDEARRGVPTHNVFLMSALSLETWLSTRSGRWTAAVPAAQTAA